jgi:N-acetylglucosaminyldiphosphoundecaprenol N-acetyl-beta-D-mannosaminyltransferase
VRLAVSDYGEVVDWMERMIAAGARGYVTAAAVNLVMSAHDEAPTAAAVAEATLAVPDGQPLVWGLRALGHGRATRIYGPDLMAAFCARAAERGIPVFLYGGRTPEALAQLEARLLERYPGLPIAGSHWPPFRPLRPDEEAEVAELIDASGAAVVWVGTGQPKQELWMQRIRPMLAAPMLVGVGAAFDFHAGIVSQAPAWMQRAGLEWLYRLSREPRRLWRRYATQNPRFIVLFLGELLRRRRDG